MSTRKPRTWVKMFQMGFVPKVRSGAKPTTIRPLPKRPQDWPQPGDLIDARHWSGKPYRSKQVKIITARINQVRRVEIVASELRYAEPNGELVSAWNAGNRPGAMMLEAIAKRDGFDCWNLMALWFEATHGLPFAGILIEWNPATISPGPACAGSLGATPGPDVSTGSGRAKSTPSEGSEITKLRSEIDRLRAELEKTESELTMIRRNPAEVRCDELAEMVFQGQQRNQRLMDRIDELKTAGAALDFSLMALGSRRSRTQIAWHRVFRKKPTAYITTQPTTPSH